MGADGECVKIRTQRLFFDLIDVGDSKTVRCWCLFRKIAEIFAERQAGGTSV
jgi:hypothetical protein